MACWHRVTLSAGPVARPAAPTARAEELSWPLSAARVGQLMAPGEHRAPMDASQPARAEQVRSLARKSPQGAGVSPVDKNYGA